MPAAGDRVLLTDAQVVAVRRAVAEGCNYAQAAFLAGVPYRLLQTRLRDQLADLRVGRGRGSRTGIGCDPTEEEIERLKRLIRERKGDAPPPADFTGSDAG